MADKKKKSEEMAEETVAQAAETQQEAPKNAKEKTSKKTKNSSDAAGIAALEEKLAEALQQQEETKNQLLRITAEYENYRRRSREEHDAAFGHGVAHAAETLLPIIDVLEAAALSPTTDEDYKKGVILTLQKCEEVFHKLGIEEIKAKGEPFDPELHNACLQEECDGVESGYVTKVIQKGYSMNGRIIRHAMVAVAP